TGQQSVTQSEDWYQPLSALTMLLPDIQDAARSSRCSAAPQPRGRSPCCQRWAQARRAASLPVCGQLGSISKCTPCLWGPVTVGRLGNGSADEAGLPLP